MVPIGSTPCAFQVSGRSQCRCDPGRASGRCRPAPVAPGLCAPVAPPRPAQGPAMKPFRGRAAYHAGRERLVDEAVGALMGRRIRWLGVLHGGLPGPGGDPAGEHPAREGASSCRPRRSTPGWRCRRTTTPGGTSTPPTARCWPPRCPRRPGPTGSTTRTTTCASTPRARSTRASPATTRCATTARRGSRSSTTPT